MTQPTPRLRTAVWWPAWGAWALVGCSGFLSASVAFVAHRYGGTRSLLLVGGLDEGGLWAAGWMGVWASGLALVGLLTARVKPRAPAARAAQLLLLVPAGLALAVLTILAGGFAVIFGPGQFATYVRLDVPDTRLGDEWLVREAHGARPSTGWSLYRGGPFLYEPVDSELDQGDDTYDRERVTPFEDGAYVVRVRGDETRLEFLEYSVRLP